jgi:hypothetical protein
MSEYKLVLSNGREIPLHPGRVTIGRGADNQVVLNVTQVSRRHAEIRYDGRDCMLVDLGSTNGTVVDGRALQPHQPYPLRPGSVVSMGGQQVFHLEESMAEAVPYYDDYTSGAPVARHFASPWVLVLGGLSLVLLVALVVLALFAFREPAGGQAAATEAPTAALPLTGTPAVVVAEAQNTVEALLPTVTMATEVEAPAAGVQPAPGAQPTPKPAVNPAPGGLPGDQPLQLPDILPTLGVWATSLAPLFPPGTPGAPPGTERYPAPTLVAPGNGASFQGQGANILLSWESVGDLKADEYYNVSVRYSQGGQIQFAGEWVQKTEWAMPDWLFGQADQGRFEWDVTVHQALTIRQDGSKEGPALSPKSETWVFTWTEKGQPEEGPSATPEFEK